MLIKYKNIESSWINTKEAAEIMSISESLLRKEIKSRDLHPRCAKKVGKRWKFNRKVLEKHGIIYVNDQTDQTDQF